MIVIANILLAIILVLVIIDLIFLNKIKQQLQTTNTTSVDEKYFELKYHLALLKSISAILFLALGIIGYSSVQDIEEEMDTALKPQQEEIKKIDSTLNEVKSKIGTINNSFKYNPRIYIVNDLKYQMESREMKFEFDKMKTIHGERLPKFSRAPFVVAQGYEFGADIVEITTTYVIVSYSVSYGSLSANADDYKKLDFWIGSQE